MNAIYRCSGTNKTLAFIYIVFLSQIFTVEREVNNFLEYDTHFLTFITIPIGALFLAIAYKQNMLLRLSVISKAVTICFIYIISHSIFHSSESIIILSSIILYGLYWLFEISFDSKDKFYFGVICFVIATFITCSFQISGITIFSKLYPDQFTTNPGVSANYLAAVLPFVLASIFYFLKNRSFLQYKVMVFISLMTWLLGMYLLIVLNARTAWVATAVGSCIIISIKINILDKIYTIKSSLLKGCIYLFSFIIAIIFIYFLYNYKVDSVIGRLLIYKVSLGLVPNNPVFGSGLGSFKVLYNLEQANYLQAAQLAWQTEILADNVFYAFNEYLQMTIELGIITLIGALFFIGLLLKTVRNALEKERSYPLIGAFASITSILICCLFSYPLHNLSVLVVLAFFISIISTYSVTVSSFMVSHYSFILFPFLLYLGFYEGLRVSALKKWEKAAYYALNGDFKNAEPLYIHSYHYLKDNGKYLFNYGSELAVANRYRESIEILERCQLHFSHTNLFLYLGNGYRILHQIKQAESNFKLASAIAPSKFLPKFHLMKFYEQNKRYEDLMHIARDVVNYPVKIPSNEVDEVKSYAGDIINHD